MRLRGQEFNDAHLCPADRTRRKRLFGLFGVRGEWGQVWKAVEEVCYGLPRMARPLRITFAGACYHVTARGNERRAIYADDPDREDFLGRLEAVVRRYDVVLHAYVLMRNHALCAAAHK